MSEPTKVQEQEDVGHSNEVTVEEVTSVGPIYKNPCIVHIELRHPINRGAERVNFHLIHIDDPCYVTVADDGTLVIIFDDDGEMMTKVIPPGQWLEKTIRRLPKVEVKETTEAA